MVIILGLGCLAEMVFKKRFKDFYVTKNTDERGVVLTYSVWTQDTPVEELGEFNSLREAREFIRRKVKKDEM